MRIPDTELARQAYAVLTEELKNVEERIAQGQLGAAEQDVALAKVQATRDRMAMLWAALGSPKG